MLTECKMPDLGDCLAERLLPSSFLHAFIGDPGTNPKERGYRRNFARLIDKAIIEYQLARRAILEEIAEENRPYEDMAKKGWYIYRFQYVDHCETCINATNRALHLFDRLKSEAILSGLSRELRRSLEACSRALPGVRNAVEHIEELIQKDEIAEGQPIMLSIGEEGDRAVIGAYEVLFTDVARTLQKLHEVGKHLFDNEQVRAAGLYRERST